MFLRKNSQNGIISKQQTGWIFPVIHNRKSSGPNFDPCVT